MAASRPRILAQRQQEKANKRVKDYDPEEQRGHSDDDDDDENASGRGSESDENSVDGTEHYVSVGSSKLRKRAALSSLGPRYQGSRISRAALQNEGGDDDDDDEDEEKFVTADEGRGTSESDESVGGAKLEKRDIARASRGTFESRRPVAADFMSSEDEAPPQRRSLKSLLELLGDPEEEEELESSDPEGDLMDEDLRDADDAEDDEDSDEEDDLDGFVVDDEEEEEEEGEDDEEEDDEENDDDDEEEEDEKNNDEEGAEPASLPKPSLQDGRRAVLSKLSEAAEKDIQKGLAIRQQRKMFDGLLNIRIRLQKALVAVNSLHVVDADTTSYPYEAAEKDAIKLWDTLGGLGDGSKDKNKNKAGQKRKRATDHSCRDSQHLWDEMQAYEQRRSRHRAAILEKWSAKMRNNENRHGPIKPLTSAIQDQLNDPSQSLVRRSRVPRSCAPLQASRKTAEDADIYDDADFYQRLLKELVDQRTVETAPVGIAGTDSVASVIAAREAKQRKNVNRKASKGRVMRFTVHDRLLSFMAPEDRTTWEQDAIDRFFGTLFGRKMELDEADVSEEDDNDGTAAETLELFRR